MATAAEGKPGSIWSFYGTYALMPALMAICWTGYWMWLVSFGPFVTDLAKEFGWSRGAMSGAYSTGALIAGFSSPVWGYVIDKIGSRRLMMAAAVLAFVSFMLLSTITDIWQLYVYWTMLMISQVFVTYIPCQRIVANWFVQRRSFMIGMITVIGGFVYIGAALTAWLVVTYGWANAWRIMGVMVLVIVLAMVLLIVRERPEDKGMRPDQYLGTSPPPPTAAAATSTQTPAAAAPEGEDYTIWQTIRTIPFWLLCLAGFVTSTALYINTVHLVPMLEGMGVDKVLAGAALGFMGLAGVPGRFIAGWLGDVLGKPRARYIYFTAIALQAIGFLIATQATTMLLIWAFVIVFGFGQGLGVPVIFIMLVLYFGAKNFATINYTWVAAVRIGTVVGPPFAGIVYDLTGNYGMAYVMGAVILAIGAVLVLFASAPRRLGAPAPGS